MDFHPLKPGVYGLMVTVLYLKSRSVTLSLSICQTNLNGCATLKFVDWLATRLLVAYVGKVHLRLQHGVYDPLDVSWRSYADVSWRGFAGL